MSELFATRKVVSFACTFNGCCGRSWVTSAVNYFSTEFGIPSPENSSGRLPLSAGCCKFFPVVASIVFFIGFKLLKD